MADTGDEVAAIDHEVRRATQDDLWDLSAPQPNYKSYVEQGGFVSPADGFAVFFNREDVQHILRHHEIFSSRVDLSLGNVRPLIPLNVDPPDHGKYRKLLDPLFAPKRMDEQEEDITRRVNLLIDGFIERGECNFSEDFADLFPTSVFLGLLGLPEQEFDIFMGMRDGILHPEKIDADASLDFDRRTEIMNETGQVLYGYFEALIDRRQQEPAPGPGGGDIITRFLAAEVEGEKLTREEILDIIFLFVIAGLDTVSDSLTCFYAFLATHPEQRRELSENPAVIPSAVEELLRWESPVSGGSPRVATQDTVLPSGNEIQEGTTVMVSYGSADVDQETFGDPFEVRFDREHNPHVAFGGGVHRCLGSHLARRELRITLREWHRRIPDYGIKPGHENLEYPPGLRHVKDLMLVWPPA